MRMMTRLTRHEASVNQGSTCQVLAWMWRAVAWKRSRCQVDGENASTMATAPRWIMYHQLRR